MFKRHSAVVLFRRRKLPSLRGVVEDGHMEHHKTPARSVMGKGAVCEDKSVWLLWCLRGLPWAWVVAPD